MPLLPRPLLRSLLPVVLGSLGLAARPAAAAVNLGGSRIVLELRLPDENGDFPSITTNRQDILEYMNLASCTCGDAARFQVDLRLDPAMSVPSGSEPVEVWVGTGCATKDITQQRSLCIDEGSVGDVDGLLSVQHEQISVRDLIGLTTSGECNRADSQTRDVYAIVDENNDGFDTGADYETHAIEIEGTEKSPPTDTNPPPEPLNPTASGGEGAIQIDWDPPTTRKDDVRYYQVLCARVDDPMNTSGLGHVDQRYLTAVDRCGSTDDGVCPRLPESTSERIVPVPAVDAGTEADAGVEADAGTTEQRPCQTGLPGGLDTLDPAYLCGETAGSSSSIRVGGLENGVTYHVVLVAVDNARNATALDVGEATPALVQDFWEDYKDHGGRAKGGCSAGQAGIGGGLALALALLLGSGARLASRRRRGRRGGPGAGGPGAAAGGAALLLALAFSPRVVSAQPWWEESEQPAEEQTQTQVGSVPNWGLELKIGPYFPDVDSEFSGNGIGPFEGMFGDGPFLMSQITVDRYLLHPMGELGVSATAGFMTRTARAYELGADGNPIINPDTGRPRRSSDTNTFRLFPTSVGVVYRFTELDDRYRIPLVPYGRAGLSYYIWRVSKPGGGPAVVDGDRAFGGSLGWQATAGLAVRAERIDRDAEMGLRNETGIEHAGLVFEFTYAKVDGFGASDKLAVGDATFFGGINFEF